VSYRIAAEERVWVAVRRIAREEIESARAELDGVTLDRTEGVHEARKHLKKTRALLRFVWPDLGESACVENTVLRDLGRTLSDLREADALREVLAEVGALSADSVRLVEAGLARHRAGVLESSEALKRRTASVATELAGFLDRIESWPCRQEEFAAVRFGLKRGYRRARRGMTVARRKPTSERLHEWRKRVKLHWYHVRLLAVCGPRDLETRESALHHLSELLGDDHDLALLRQTLESSPDDFGGLANVHAVVAAIDARREELQREAHALGRELFGLKPRDFTDRVGRAWKARR
jgi:CHAD domain-containing protein